MGLTLAPDTADGRMEEVGVRGEHCAWSCCGTTQQLSQHTPSYMGSFALPPRDPMGGNREELGQVTGTQLKDTHITHGLISEE